jgi:hypothetical protein
MVFQSKIQVKDIFATIPESKTGRPISWSGQAWAKGKYGMPEHLTLMK